MHDLFAKNNRSESLSGYLPKLEFKYEEIKVCKVYMCFPLSYNIYKVAVYFKKKDKNNTSKINVLERTHSIAG